MNINENISNETVLTLSQACRQTGKSRNTLQKWITVGVKGGIVLEVIPAGGQWRTSRQALQRFHAAVVGAVEARRKAKVKQSFRDDAIPPPPTQEEMEKSLLPVLMRTAVPVNW